jgi:hypothetical protein
VTINPATNKLPDLYHFYRFEEMSGNDNYSFPHGNHVLIPPVNFTSINRCPFYRKSEPSLLQFPLYIKIEFQNAKAQTSGPAALALF